MYVLALANKGVTAAGGSVLLPAGLQLKLYLHQDRDQTTQCN